LNQIADFGEKNDDKQVLYVVYSYMAQCYFRMGNYSECIAYCTKGLQIRYIKKYLHFRGKSFIELFNYKNAIKDFENILENHSDDEDARNQLRICQNYTADNQESITNAPVSNRYSIFSVRDRSSATLKCFQWQVYRTNQYAFLIR
jgi:tetratricopeptide (TPR) repeat protein